MRKHARANAVADDLWSALGEASKQPVVELANAWIGQSGFPLVSVKVEGRTVTLSQQRFYLGAGGEERGDAGRCPWCCASRTRAGVREQRVLFRDAQTTVTLEGARAT